MTTVYEVLNNNRFKNLKVLNNNANLSRVISSIDTAETPDAFNYIAQNTFVITTGMIFKDNQNELCNYLIELNKVPISGIAIKTGRFIGKLDPKVIKLCDKLELPLILIPDNETLGSISSSLVSTLWGHEQTSLLNVLNMQKKFYNLILRDASLDMLVKNLSLSVSKPTALVDPFGNISVSTNQIDKDSYKKIIRITTESFSKYPNNKPEIYKIRLEGSTKYNVLYFYPIQIANYHPFYLVIFSDNKSDYKTSNILIEHAALVLAFTIYKDLRSDYNRLISKESFIYSLIKDDFYKNLENEQIINIGRKYNLMKNSNYQIIIMQIVNDEHNIKDYSFKQEQYTLVYSWLQNKIKSDFKNMELFPSRENSLYLLLLQTPYNYNFDDNYLYEKLENYRNILRKTVNLDAIFGLGNKTTEISNIRYCYNEAIQAIQNGSKLNNKSFIKIYNPIESNDLLRLIPLEHREIFTNNILKTLKNPTDENLLGLRETLEVYVNNNCNISKTSDILFIHRNTVSYRLNKCTDLLEIDFDNPSDILNLKICFELLKHN